MSLKGIALAVASVLMLGTSVFAQSDITVVYHSDILAFNEKPIIRNDKTLVQLRPIAEAMGLQIDYIDQKGEVILSAGETTVVFTKNSDIIKVNGDEIKMIAPATNHNDYTFVPVRDLAEPFGEIVSYDGETKTVSIDLPEQEVIEEAVMEETEQPEDIEESEAVEPEVDFYAEYEPERPVANPLYELKDVATGSGKYDATYYYQSQPDMALENSGRGYCWVCSYAMVISDLKGEKVSPLQVANVNLEAGFGGNFMYHTGIIGEFGMEFVPALSEDSAYFDYFDDALRGETFLKVTEDADVISAIKEALDRNPKGVMVRFDGYPHTMVAVGYEGDTIFYNDPGLAKGEHVTFEETCLKNFSLCDISYIQAIRPVEE